MVQGVNGDLADITIYTNTTPVHFTTSNVPLTELDANIVILDQKLEGWIESGQVATGHTGDGSPALIPVVFATVMNAVPDVTLGMADLSGTGINTAFAEILNRTVSGFDLQMTGVGTAGAWTVNVSWIADGR
ncbi:MAG: hypothetical protein ACXABY_05650 [Candidatus Thorarchaeota archaeon]|jgi:hypothetical protein